MSTLFYDHIVAWDQFRKELAERKIMGKVAADLEAELDELLHHKLLHTALDILPKSQREHYFSEVLKKPSSPLHMQVLLRHDSYSEEKLRVAADALIAEILAAIDRSRVVK